MSMTTGTNTTSVRVVKIGDQDHTVLASNDPWFRYLEGLAGLFLAGEISLSTLALLEANPSFVVHSGRGDEAARQMCNFIGTVWMAPSCLCDPFDKPCGHGELTENERREHLAMLMGVSFQEPLAGTDDEGEGL